MFKVIRKKLEDLRCRWVTFARYLVLYPGAIIALALAYMVTAPGGQGDVQHLVSLVPVTAGANEATELAILQWMKEHSEMSEQVLEKIYRVAMNSVNADLILAICLVESNFNPHVESDKGAVGLMGIMPDVWLEELKTQGIVREEDDLYTISSNINSGIYVLGKYLARTNNLREALRRYSGGDSAYAAKVLRLCGEIARTRRSEDQRRLATLRTIPQFSGAS